MATNPPKGDGQYDAKFAQRHVGAGPFAQLLARRFRLAHPRLGFEGGRERRLDTTQFVAPRRSMSADVEQATERAARGNEAMQGELF